MGRRRTWTREEALARATDAFHTGGYSATSVRTLAQATGVAPPDLYAEFGGKEGLFTQAVEAYVAAAEAWYDDVLGGDHTGMAPLRRHFEAFRFDGDPRGCLLVNALRDGAEIPRRARRHIDAFFERVRARFESHLCAARERGRLPADTDPAALSAALLAFDLGLAVAATSPGRRRGLAAGVRAWFDALERPAGNL